MAHSIGPTHPWWVVHRCSEADDGKVGEDDDDKGDHPDDDDSENNDDGGNNEDAEDDNDSDDGDIDDFPSRGILAQ